MNEEIQILPPYGNLNGVKDSVALKVADMLKDGRRYFGVSGASLTHLIKDRGDTGFTRSSISVGLMGERATTYKLKKWLETKPNAVLIDSVHVKGIVGRDGEESDGDTDHVLVIGSQVFLIDTKKWRSRGTYSVSPKGVVLRGGKPFKGSAVKARQAKSLWKRFLHSSARVNSIVCISSEKAFITMDDNWKSQAFKLLNYNTLENHLNFRYSKFSEKDKTTINSSLVSQIVACCVKPYDSYQGFMNMNTLEKFKQEELGK